MDYYSKFSEISGLSFKTSSSVVVNLKSIFARHGVPDELVADNRPFASRELRHSASSWGFQLISSSPGYPKSNGMSERTIGTIKQLLREAEYPGDWNWSLSLADAKQSATEVQIANHGRTEKLVAAQQRQEFYYDRHAKP